MKKIKILSAALFALFAVTVMFTSCQKSDDTIAPQKNGDPMASKNVQDDNEIITTTGERWAPTVPPAIEVPAGNDLYFHVYATGTQIYVDSLNASGAYAWILRAPAANLYLLPCYQVKVGTHYVGPTWGNNHGSVLGTKLAAAPSPDPTAIPWLLVQKVSTSGTGIFTWTTYVQRINTAGGIAPATVADAAHAGQVEAVPYTAEYFFYKAH